MLRREGFKDVHFTVGAISIENQKAKVTRYADGVVTGDAVWINATAKKWTVEQLANHEAFHHRIKDWPYTMDAVRQALADELGDSGIQELAQRYAEAYEGCYDGAELDAYIEEICADAYAGMDPKDADHPESRPAGAGGPAGGRRKRRDQEARRKSTVWPDMGRMG